MTGASAPGDQRRIEETFEAIAAEVRPFFGQVVLMHDCELALLLGVGWTEADIYYIARPQGYQRQAVWYSAVGRCVGLKDHLPEGIYAPMAHIFALNGDIPDTFEMKVRIADEDVVDYDPETHPGVVEEARQRAWDAAVRAARTS